MGKQLLGVDDPVDCARSSTEGCVCVGGGGGVNHLRVDDSCE